MMAPEVVECPGCRSRSRPGERLLIHRLGCRNSDPLVLVDAAAPVPPEDDYAALVALTGQVLEEGRDKTITSEANYIAIAQVHATLALAAATKMIADEQRLIREEQDGTAYSRTGSGRRPG